MTDKTGKLDSNKNSTENVLSLPKTSESPLRFESFSSSKLHDVARSATAELSAALGGQEFTANVDQESLEAYEVVSVMQVDVISSLAAQYTSKAIEAKYDVTDSLSLAKISLTIANEGISDISNYSLDELVDLKSRADEFATSDTLALTEMAIKSGHPQHAELISIASGIYERDISQKYDLMSSSKPIGTKVIKAVADTNLVA